MEHIDTNYKSQLLEYTQKYRLQLSFVTDANGVIRPGADDNFFAKVFIDDVEIASAFSFSKKDAEQRAAKIAIEIIGDAIERKK